MWLVKNPKMIMSGIGAETNPRVPLHTSLMFCLLLKQYMNEFNNTYLTRFKLSVERLHLEGGLHIFTSKQMLGTLGTETSYMLRHIGDQQCHMTYI